MEELVESWGTMRAKASTSSSSAAVATDTVSVLSASVGNRLGRRRAHVLRAGPDDAVVTRLFEDVGAPPDHPAGGERRCEHLSAQPADLHDDPRVPLDV